MERQILHIDVNNAFLSWSAIELLKNGYETDIRTIPSIIGGDESRRAGIVLAKSIKAKASGIITGEPIFFAKQKCPGLSIFPTNFEVYGQYSNQLYNLLLEYTNMIERFSVDECFLDLTDALYKKNIYDVAIEIKDRLENELGFTVNIGLSNNKLLAKMASDFEKPNKIHTLYPNEIKEKMWPLPINELFMLGKKSVPKLNNLGFKKIEDLAKADKNFLIKKLGKHGLLIWEYSNGIDNSPINYHYENPKGVGNSTTLPKDITNIDNLELILLELLEQVTYRLRKYKLKANVVTVQLRTSDFKDFTHQRKLPYSTNGCATIYKTAKEILIEMYNNQSIRLVGVRVDKLVNENEAQMSLFDNTKEEQLEKTLDTLKNKYGYYKIRRGGRRF